MKPDAAAELEALRRRLAAKPDRLATALEGFIASLKWSPEATEHEKTLVIGNLRVRRLLPGERSRQTARANRARVH